MSGDIGIYIHIPFCVKKCNYCAFLSFAADEALREKYTEALISEIMMTGRQLAGRKTGSIYIGGGTPSVMNVSQISRIMRALEDSFDIIPDAEITLEANPGTLGSTDREIGARLSDYRTLGINRLSMGVQSMNDERLRFLGRIHTSGDVLRDFRCARRAGFGNINLDLIFSVPGQSTDDALRDAERIIRLGPEHISCYSLQLEEGTPFYNMAEAGEISETDDEEDRMTYHSLCRLLRSSGYEHYEISNFAVRSDPADRRSRFRSRHNSLYWNMSEYAGLGLGASGYTGGIRYCNTQDIEEYLSILEGEERCSGGSGPDPGMLHEEEHRNTAFDNISEAVFTGLRRREGITYKDAVDAYLRSGDHIAAETADCGEIFWQIFEEAREEADRAVSEGLLIIDGDGMRMTEAGIDISNSIMALFV